MTVAPAAYPDLTPGARRLYRIGAGSVALFLVTGIVVPMLLMNSVSYDTTMQGEKLIAFIAAHRVWWFVLQNLTMGSMIFVIPPLLALYPALRHADFAVALVGIALAISCQVLFMAYFPVVNGLLWLADRYADATSDEARAALAASADALAAQNSAYGTSDGIFALSIGMIGHAMRRSVFPRWLVWLGYLAATLGIGLAFTKPLIGLHYLWWWATFVVWFIAVGWRLWALSREPKTA